MLQFPNITAHAPVPQVLDLSRSFSRHDHPVATGVDRVERAYWRELCDRPDPALALVRYGRRVYLFDQDGATILMWALQRGELAQDVRVVGFRLSPRLHRFRLRRVLHRLALRTCSPEQLAAMLRRFLGRPFDYLNVGHSHLDRTALLAIRAGGARHIRVMLHDMIPLDHPEFVRPETPPVFESCARAAVAFADQIICNSGHTAERVRHHAGRWGHTPDLLVAYLGVDVPANAASQVTAPYFLCVGTLEPRKNHQFLFRVWRELAENLPAEQVPQLILVGRRGWENHEVFDFLDGSDPMLRHITELGAVDDARLYDLMAGARALLFPSLAEGFGLPAVEAQAMGVPVICSPLPVFHEVLAGRAQLLPLSLAHWAESVARLAAQPAQRNRTPAPTWAQHFECVFGVSERSGAVTRPRVLSGRSAR